VFQQAILKDDKDQPIRDTQGKTIPQLLLLPRICFACHHCWGEEMSKAIMLHFWEVEFQSQLNFQMVFDELEDTLNHEDVAVVKEVGTIQRKTLPPIDFTEKVSDNVTRKTRVIRKRKPLWLIGFSPASGVLNANRPILNYINKRNDGCGIGLLEDAFTGTKVLFKGSAVPGDKWKRLVSLIQFKEDGHWHDPSSNPKEAAPFILNGNKAHQYVPRSGISLDTLAQLVRKIFHS